MNVTKLLIGVASDEMLFYTEKVRFKLKQLVFFVVDCSHLEPAVPVRDSHLSATWKRLRLLSMQKEMIQSHFATLTSSLGRLHPAKKNRLYFPFTQTPSFIHLDLDNPNRWGNLHNESSSIMTFNWMNEQSITFWVAVTTFWLTVNEKLICNRLRH